MKNKYGIILVVLAAFLLALFASINFKNSFHSKSDQQASTQTSTPTETSEEKSRRLNNQINKGDVPECLLGRCPEYLEGTICLCEETPCVSVVVVPTAMTKGAGQVWLIRAGEVVYKTPELSEVSAKIEEDGDGRHLFISYVSVWEDGIYPSEITTAKISYVGGNYELTTVSKEKQATN